VVDERLKQVRETSLTESRVNEDFLDWLKTKGPSYLLAVMIGICAWLGILKWRQYHANRATQAWFELLNAGLPGQLEDVAAEYADVPGVAPQATLRAADELLNAVQAGRQIGAPAEQGTPPLGDQDRSDYLDRAARLYRSLVDADDGSLGAALRTCSAMQGLAAIAESRAEAPEARSWYEKAAARVEKDYADLARRLRGRAAVVDTYVAAPTLPDQSSLPPRPATEKRDPVFVEEPLRDLLFPQEPAGG
jgi:hypothetical protein